MMTLKLSKNYTEVLTKNSYAYTRTVTYSTFSLPRQNSLELL